MAALRRNVHVLRKLITLSPKSDLPLCQQHAKSIHTCRRLLAKKDPFAVFMRDDIHQLLEQLTRSSAGPDTVFKNLCAPLTADSTIKVLTDQELQEELAQGRQMVEANLQMPPFLSAREPRENIISSDPDIAPALNAKYVFIDISEAGRIKKYGDRPVVVRHENGDLTTADWETYDRIMQIYSPVNSREIYMPKMFEEQTLEDLLKTGAAAYHYILERACVQFEPDNDHFVRVTQRVYEDIYQKALFREIRGTRFYGPMIFYFCWTKKSLDPILVDCLRKNLVEEAANMINVSQLVQDLPALSGTPLEIVQTYNLSNKSQYQPEVTEAIREYIQSFEKGPDKLRESAV